MNRKILILPLLLLAMMARGESSDDGMLSGAFSVSDGVQVHFSQGNLQYQARKRTWRFAENQYDIVGNDNSNISSSYSEWIDLFGWGTGKNPTKTNTGYSDYSDFVDWGKNAISNGGNKAKLWRTLTMDEWVYLFLTRMNAASLFGLGSVNGVNGTIILPDDWVTPQGITFTPSSQQGLVEEGGYYYNTNGDSFSHNTYSIEQWRVMEQSGAVFLPCGGRRHGTEVRFIGLLSGYWSATPDGMLDAHFLNVASDRLVPQNSDFRGYGRSVRLVRSLEK